jgi:AbrB family transcriptional regulator (stage V sporulation protein T)
LNILKLLTNNSNKWNLEVNEMKETGVVRHLDELGRIVIPKEIRRNLRMNEGDLLEIFVDDKESVVLKKHTPFKILEDDCYHLSKTLFDYFKNTILVTDLEKVVNGFGYKYGEYLDKYTSNVFRKRLENTDSFSENINIINDKESENILAYVLSNKEEIYGSIIMIEDNKKITEEMKFILEFVSTYFAKKLDI